MDNKSSFDDNLREAIETSGYVPGAASREVQRRLPTAPFNPEMPDKSTLPAFRIRAFNAEDGNLDDLTLSGNESDREKTVKTGLVKTDTYNSVYEGGSALWSRYRGNEAFTMLASAVQNTGAAGAVVTQTSSLLRAGLGIMPNYNARGGHIILNVTAVPGVVTITPTLQAFDEGSGTWYNLLAGTAMVATGQQVLKIYPGIVPVPNQSASDCMPLNFRVSVAHSAAGNFTYSIGCNLVV